MSLKNEFRKMVDQLAANYELPPIENVFLPPFQKGGQPKDAQFMAISLGGGAAGVSYVLLPDEKMEEYSALGKQAFVGKAPQDFALQFGSEDPLQEMVSLAAINAICQHVMRVSDIEIDHATDSLGLLSVSAGDKIGMVGFFFALVKTIKKAGADLVVVEKKEDLLAEYPDLPITLDPSELSSCNKVLCTSTTILNNSLDNILSHCAPDAFVSIIGPTAGYFPDPLFARGVDVVGGRIIKDGPRFLNVLAEKKRWGLATERTCFQKSNYRGFI